MVNASDSTVTAWCPTTFEFMALALG